LRKKIITVFDGLADDVQIAEADAIEVHGSFGFGAETDITSCAGGRHNMPRPCKLTFDLLTLKVVSESRV